ncbi:MAG TPA: Xaa-Pro peptidase family protein [Bryobacteraceae bacterium]|jgi:Xaa-Pro aminopeptidase|nr:Xaa-Pro peptidase family protein [Bryobacteraceae bacterium]
MQHTNGHSEFAERRARLEPTLAEARANAFLTTARPNVHYLSGFTGSNGAVLILPGRVILFTDPRYATQAPQQSDCEVVVAKGPLLAEVGKWARRLKLRSLAFEQNRISFEEFTQLRSVLKNVRLKPVNGCVEALRMRKSASEIGTIKASVRLNSIALEQALEQFQPDMTEVDLAAEIEYRMRLLGADGTAFETIVASGERTALPHAHPTNHPIQRNQLLLVDMGASVAGYASDMTRTHALGKLNAKTRRMYKAVLESQLAAIEAVKPGASCTAVDRAARTVLREYGLEKYFIHSTGHGLGLEIHEGPRVGRKEKTKLEPGMVITIEPGVYQEGLGGIRIEDTVLVSERGHEVLTPTGKELVVL